MYLITIVNNNRPTKFYADDLSKVTSFIDAYNPECTVVEPLPDFAELNNQKGGNNE